MAKTIFLSWLATSIQKLHGKHCGVTENWCLTEQGTYMKRNTTVYLLPEGRALHY